MRLTTLWILFFALCSSLFAEEPIQRAHIPYLVQRGELSKGLELYRKVREQEGRHDFEILHQVGAILLDKGAASDQGEVQLLTLYGSAYASLSSTLSILEVAIKSRHLETQLAAVHLMARFDDDRCSALLNKAMGSDFLYTRMEAAQQLCLRKDRMAVGQIEALMHRVPREFKVYFPPLFGAIGTSDGTKILKTLLDDGDEQVRVEAVLSAARNGREELLPMIRSMATHPAVREQEACAFALGELSDSHSIPQLKRLALSPNPAVKLAANRSLFRLGETQAKESIIELAKGGDLFAISALSDVEGAQESLVPLLRSEDPHVRLGAALSLLKLRDARATDPIIEVLIHDSRDLGFYPTSTAGHTLLAWKALPSLQQHQKTAPSDLVGMTLSFREHTLRECLELPPAAFLKVARSLFRSKQFDLIPMLVRLLENLESPEPRALLKMQYQTSGIPLIRAYCSLALYRLHESGPFEAEILSWLKRNQGKELIEFKKVNPKKLKESHTPYELTPAERSRLLIETAETVAGGQTNQGIDLILELLENGNPKNQYLLAGLLLKALQ